MPDQSFGSLPISATDPSGASIYGGHQFYSPLTGQNYPMAPSAPAAPTLPYTAPQPWFGGPNSVMGNIGSAFTGAAQGYLGQEQQMLSGQMTAPEMAGFVGGHMLPGAGEALGARYPSAPGGQPGYWDAGTWVPRDPRAVWPAPVQDGRAALDADRYGPGVLQHGDLEYTPQQPHTAEDIARVQGDLSGFSDYELLNAASHRHITPDQYEAEINRRRSTGSSPAVNPPGVPDWYQQANQPLVRPGSPGQENVLQFPGADLNQMMPLGGERATPGMPGQENVTQLPSPHPHGEIGDQYLREQLGQLMGTEPSAIQHPMAEAQRYLDYTFGHGQLDPQMRNILIQWAQMHGLRVPPDA